MKNSTDKIKLILETALSEGNVSVIAMIRASISEEQLAIAHYIERAEKCDKLGDTQIAKVFRDIAEEEQVHVGELTYLLKLAEPSDAKLVDDGEKEAKDMII